jgi:hypothetical protein
MYTTEEKIHIMHLFHANQSIRNLPDKFIQGVSAKIFEPNNSVIFQRIFVKFKMRIF